MRSAFFLIAFLLTTKVFAGPCAESRNPLEVTTLQGLKYFVENRNTPTGNISYVYLRSNESLSHVLIKQNMISSHFIDISSVAVDERGFIVVAGDAFGNPGVQINFNGKKIGFPYQYGTYIAKYNPNGKLVWARIFEHGTAIEPIVLVDQNSNIYYSEAGFKGMKLGPFTVQGSAWIRHFILVQLDSQGNFKWLQEAKSKDTANGVGDAFMTAISINLENELCIIGFSSNYIRWSDDIVTDTQTEFRVDTPIEVLYSADGSVVSANLKK